MIINTNKINYYLQFLQQNPKSPLKILKSESSKYLKNHHQISIHKTSKQKVEPFPKSTLNIVSIKISRLYKSYKTKSSHRNVH